MLSLLKWPSIARNQTAGEVQMWISPGTRHSRKEPNGALSAPNRADTLINQGNHTAKQIVSPALTSNQRSPALHVPIGRSCAL